MKGVIAKTALPIGQVLGAVAERLGYKLTVIEEETVPLSDGRLTGQNTLLGAALVILLLLAGIAVSIYRVRCKSYRERIVQLSGGSGLAYKGWNLRKLKETTRELEWNLVGEEY